MLLGNIWKRELCHGVAFFTDRCSNTSSLKHRKQIKHLNKINHLKLWQFIHHTHTHTHAHTHTYKHIYIYIYIFSFVIKTCWLHSTWISLTLNHYSSLSIIAFSGLLDSIQCLLKTKECNSTTLVGQCVGIHKSSSLFIQHYWAYRISIGCEILGKCQYGCCFVGCCLQYLFKTASRILSFSANIYLEPK